MPKLQTDELNNQEFDAVEYIRDYFEPMEISDEQKEIREEAAKDFRDVLLFLFALISAYSEHDIMDWAAIEYQFRLEFESVALKYSRDNESLQDYITAKTSDFVGITREHDLLDPYWTSDERATKEAVNDANTVITEEEWQLAKDAGATHKRWKTQNDEIVRKSHRKVNRATIGIDRFFVLDRGMVRFPGDEYFSKEESINCRCGLDFLNPDGKIVGVYWTKRGALVNKTRGKVQFTTHNSSSNIDYKEVVVNTSIAEAFTTYNEGVPEIITASPLVGGDNNIYISDKIPLLKRKALSKIETWIKQSKKLLSFDGAVLPKIVIVDATELLSTTGGRYNPTDNVIYIKPNLPDLKKTKHTVLHEFYHWRDAQEYISQGHTIVDGAAYYEMRNARSKRILDKLGITESEAMGISTYAGASYLSEKRTGKPKYDETYTEYRTIKNLGKIR